MIEIYYIGNTSDISDSGDIVTSHTGAWLCIQSILDNCDLLENVSICEIVSMYLFFCLFVRLFVFVSVLVVQWLKGSALDFQLRELGFK